MSDEADLLEEDEELAPETDEEVSAFANKLKELQSRCDASGIDFKHEADDIGEYAEISINSGKGKRKIGIYSDDRLESLLSIEFEKYRFLSGYDSIYCNQEKYIECGLRTTRISSNLLLARLNGKKYTASHTDLTPFSLLPPDSLQNRPTLEIGPCSREFLALGGGRPSRLTLKLKGARATQHDLALAELRSYADSTFLQIDMLFGSTFILERELRRRVSPLSRKPGKITLEYPSAHYNDDAMSLYWYAKSARDMPLLRFLAFYQSIEFYFPRYSQTEARRRVGSIIKNPTFRAHRDDDLDRLISAIQSTRSGNLGSERSQLRAAITECISAHDMREYITETAGREEYYAGKGAQKNKYHKIPILNKAADIRNDVADRIYDIRCKIVHTKNEHSEDDYPMILPFSDDADFLLPDIDLVEFVAKCVLVASSGELT